MFGDWVESALGSVEARILRIKGIVAMRGVDARVIVQGISEAVEVLLGAPWGDAPRTSRLVVLGLGLDPAALEAGFRRCAADPSAAVLGDSFARRRNADTSHDTWPTSSTDVRSMRRIDSGTASRRCTSAWRSEVFALASGYSPQSNAASASREWGPGSSARYASIANDLALSAAAEAWTLSPATVTRPHNVSDNPVIAALAAGRAVNVQHFHDPRQDIHDRFTDDLYRPARRTDCSSNFDRLRGGL